MSDQDQRYTIQEFLDATAQQDRGQGLFELETERLLELNLDGMMWIKTGVMVAYRGEVKYTREGILSRGVGNLLKKAVSGEGTKLTRAEGRGQVYLADEGKKITIIKLENQSVVLNANDILAFEPQLQYDIKLVGGASGFVSGGLFNALIEGTGHIAFTTHYDPMTLRVTPDNPVYTDPNATVLWSANLKPKLKRDVSLKTFVGRTSGESLQMQWEGEGYVVVQPYEEAPLQISSTS